MRLVVRMLFVMAVLGAAIASPTVVFGYDHTAAANYADAHWSTCAPATYPCFSNDCTNFVSQSLHLGSYPFRGYMGTTSDDHNWYAVRLTSRIPYIYQYTRSWSYAYDLYEFLLLDNPGGYVAATYPGNSTLAATAANKGDVYFYDWDYRDSSFIDHTSINVGYGSTDDGHFGDYVDEHTSFRHHVFWTLQQYNVTLAPYTTVYAMVVSSSN